MGGGPHLPLLPHPGADRLRGGQGLVEHAVLPVPRGADGQTEADRAGHLPAG